MGRGREDRARLKESAIALALNDVLGFEARQLLLPYVTRLAGTADAPGVELDRVRMIAFGIAKHVLPIAYRFSHLPRYVEFLDRVTDPKLVFYILRNHREEWRSGFSSKPHVGLVMAVEALIASIENLNTVEAAHLAAHAVYQIVHGMFMGHRHHEAVFAPRAIEALDMALAIGRAPEIEAVDRIRAQARLDMARLEAAHQ